MPVQPITRSAVITDLAGQNQAYRKALGRFATGVTVATCATRDGQRIGVTVNSFTSVSLDPPLVLFCLRKEARSLAAFQAAGAFVVNVLSRAQRDLSIRFAGDATDWDGVAYETMVTGAPAFPDGLAAFDCRLEAVYPGGDHVILLGRVVAFASAVEGGTPLLYDRGRYAGLEGEV